MIAKAKASKLQVTKTLDGRIHIAWSLGIKMQPTQLKVVR